MSEAKRQSPLVGQDSALQARVLDGAGVSLRERPFLGHLSVRGRSDDAAFLSACEQALGVAVPVVPNTQVRGEGLLLGWMGPTEWLLMVEDADRLSRKQALESALQDGHAAVVDLTGGQTLIEVRGPHAMDVISKGCTLDIHPRVFGADSCTRTFFAQSSIFLSVIEPGQAFGIVIRRSFADHVWRWLCDAAQEYGCSYEGPETRLPVAQA